MSVQTSRYEEKRYTFSSEDCTILHEKPAHGFQLDHTNVGKARDNAIYLDQAEDYHTATAYADNLKTGNIVRVTYRLRSVKTPYRIAFLHLSELEDCSYQDGYNQRKFVIFAEPINNNASHLFLNGIVKIHKEINRKHMEYHRTKTVNTVGNKRLILDNLEEKEDPYGTISGVGKRANNFRKLRILSDITINELFELKEPSILAYTI